jgi:DNA-directed RNA polymerase subunit RPC12/RpoP
MPDHEEHCLHSLKRYGIRGDDIHSWIDEPVAVAGASHREYRHSLESLHAAIQIFGSKYGADAVENIFLDHLKADSEENRKKEVERSHIEEKISVRAFPVLSLDSTIDGLGRYLNSIITSAPKSPSELVNSVKRSIQYHSYHEIDYSVDQSFKTSIGQIHRESVNHGRLLLNLKETSVAGFLNLNQEIMFGKLHEDSDGMIVSHEVANPREFALKQVKALHSKQVSYTARANSRRYKKFCEISERNIRLNSLHLVYLPIIKLDFNLLQTPYVVTIAQNVNGDVLRIDNQEIRNGCLCNTCGKLFHEGGSIETIEGFKCSKCGHTTCRKDGHWRKRHILFKEFVCPKCYEEGKNSGISYLEFN